MVDKPFLHLSDIMFAPDKTGQLYRQVVGDAGLESIRPGYRKAGQFLWLSPPPGRGFRPPVKVNLLNIPLDCRKRHCQISEQSPDMSGFHQAEPGFLALASLKALHFQN